MQRAVAGGLILVPGIARLARRGGLGARGSAVDGQRVRECECECVRAGTLRAETCSGLGSAGQHCGSLRRGDRMGQSGRDICLVHCRGRGRFNERLGVGRCVRRCVLCYVQCAGEGDAFLFRIMCACQECFAGGGDVCIVSLEKHALIDWACCYCCGGGGRGQSEASVATLRVVSAGPLEKQLNKEARLRHIRDDFWEHVSNFHYLCARDSRARFRGRLKLHRAIGVHGELETARHRKRISIVTKTDQLAGVFACNHEGQGFQHT